MFLAITAYIKNIALLMLLAVFVEMLVPNDKIKKYVSVIIGLILIFTVVGKISDVMVSLTNSIDEVPAFEYAEGDASETENVTDTLTGILYDEMNEVDSDEEEKTEFKVKVEEVKPYN